MSVGPSDRTSVRPFVTFINSELFSPYCSSQTICDWIALYPAMLSKPLNCLGKVIAKSGKVDIPTFDGTKKKIETRISDDSGDIKATFWSPQVRKYIKETRNKSLLLTFYVNKWWSKLSLHRRMNSLMTANSTASKLWIWGESVQESLPSKRKQKSKSLKMKRFEMD